MKKKKETTVEKVEETEQIHNEVDNQERGKKKITVYELKDELESLQLICTNLFHVKSQLRNVNQPHNIVESDRNYTAQINAILAKLGNIEI